MPTRFKRLSATPQTGIQSKLAWTLRFLSLQDVTLALNTRGSITYNFGGTNGITTETYSSLGNFIDDFTGADPGTISKGFEAIPSSF